MLFGVLPDSNRYLSQAKRSALILRHKRFMYCSVVIAIGFNLVLQANLNEVSLQHEFIMQSFSP